MEDSSFLRLLEHELRKTGQAGTIPIGTRCLCDLFGHQFYLRDRAHGDLLTRFEALKADVDKLKYQGDSA